MCMIDGNDRPDFYAATTPRSRRARKCDECGRAISAEERYQRVFSVYRGDGASTFSTCAHCVVAMEWLMENCGGYAHGGVWEDLEEHIGEYPTLAFPLSRLAVARRRLWRRFDGLGLMAVPPVPPSLEQAGLA